MTYVPAKTVTDALHWRYATKKFDPARTIPEETWAALEQALVLSPSSFGFQPWKFVVVQDRATREKLAGASYGQRHPLDCSHFVVFSARKNLGEADINKYLDRTVQVRGVPRESLKGLAQVMTGSTDAARRDGSLDHWMARQVYIALGGFMTAAALLQVDACPMEGIEPAKFDEILGLTALGYGTLCACAAGYRSPADAYASQAKVRYRPEDVILHV
jgi:nitroreductase